MPGIGMNPSNCCCCDEPTRLCITLFNQCAFEDSFDVDVTITGPNGSRTLNTGEGNEVCFSGVVPGHYTIATAKSGCTTPSGSTNVACGDDKSIVLGSVNCTDGANFDFVVLGCGDNPLPGAECSISGANSGACTTDAEGRCSIPISNTGFTAWTVTHPSGRFDSASGGLNIFGLCEPSGVEVSLSPADGYACCFPGSDDFPDNPYPVSTSLIWTDCTGEYAFSLNPVGCGQDICASMTLGDVSLEGTSDCVTCIGGGVKKFPPTDIGFHPINVLLSITLGNLGPNKLRYFYRTFTAVGVKRLDYKTGAVCPDCGINDASRSWRMNATCEDLESNISTGGINWETRASISYTVNSVIPFNMTATINPSGNGYGPGAPFTGWSGAAPCETVVISETI